jgi:hypothetical protein
MFLINIFVFVKNILLIFICSYEYLTILHFFHKFYKTIRSFLIMSYLMDKYEYINFLLSFRGMAMRALVHPFYDSAKQDYTYNMKLLFLDKNDGGTRIDGLNSIFLNRNEIHNYLAKSDINSIFFETFYQLDEYAEVVIEDFISSGLEKKVLKNLSN